mmetsp:Transcript_11457/g.26071  ORF Transcript_11457/g.26071 Transcript_11457/m.26071 type:complete len:210 (+) Transcript_11457:582-1211(+)
MAKHSRALIRRVNPQPRGWHRIRRFLQQPLKPTQFRPHLSRRARRKQPKPPRSPKSRRRSQRQVVLTCHLALPRVVSNLPGLSPIVVTTTTMMTTTTKMGVTFPGLRREAVRQQHPRLYQARVWPLTQPRLVVAARPARAGRTWTWELPQMLLPPPTPSLPAPKLQMMMRAAPVRPRAASARARTLPPVQAVTLTAVPQALLRSARARS